MYWISRYLDPWPWPIFHAPTFTRFTSTFHYHWAVDIAIRGNGTGLEYMCPTRHFVYIFFNPVIQLRTAKNEINLLNNHILIVAPVTFVPAGAMTPSAEFLFIQERFNKLIYGINTIIKCGIWQPVKFQLVSCFWTGSKLKWFFIISPN